MTEILRQRLNDSPVARWTVLLIVATAMMMGYFVNDVMSPLETLLEMLTSTKFCLIHMTRFSIDEIVEIDGWDEQNNRLIFNQIYDKKMEMKNGK